MKFSPCIEIIFNDTNIADRVKKVKDAGFDAYEFWSCENKDLALLESINRELGLEIAAFCTKSGSLVDPAARAAYVAGLRESIKIAERLGTKRLISTTGNELAGVDRSRQHMSLVDGLKDCAKILEDSGITLVLEPLNILVNHPGYYLSTSKEAFEILNEVDSPNIMLLFDIYHQQITEGNLISNITANIGKIGHFHAADNPGRHEPGTGEINYKCVFDVIDASGYTGFVGLEYVPSIDPADSLKATKMLPRDRDRITP
jgi:hydroxypyruvate isomerase